MARSSKKSAAGDDAVTQNGVAPVVMVADATLTPESGATAVGSGVLEIGSEGFGFLRGPRLLPGPDDGLEDAPTPKNAVAFSLSARLLVTCAAEIPVGSPLALLILSASSCAVSG